jgi:hypothetical protein
VKELVDQTILELRHRHAGAPIELRDTEPQANYLGLREGDPMPADWRTPQLPGGLRRSGHAGRVISVR